jgi:hypothetical protein
MNAFLPAEGPRTYESSSPFELRHASTHRPFVVVVPERRFLAINGAGPREAADFRLATTLLRTVGEIIRAKIRRARGSDPLRSVLEVTWPLPPGLTIDEILEVLSSPTPRWRQMIELPHIAIESTVLEAIDEARQKGHRDTALVRLAHITEGLVVQILHLGRSEETSSIRKLYAFVAESDFIPSGDLHELVVADRNIVGQARARSILRVPIAYRTHLDPAASTR